MSGEVITSFALGSYLNSRICLPCARLRRRSYFRNCTDLRTLKTHQISDNVRTPVAVSNYTEVHTYLLLSFLYFYTLTSMCACQTCESSQKRAVDRSYCFDDLGGRLFFTAAGPLFLQIASALQEVNGPK